VEVPELPLIPPDSMPPFRKRVEGEAGDKLASGCVVEQDRLAAGQVAEHDAVLFERSSDCVDCEYDRRRGYGEASAFRRSSCVPMRCGSSSTKAL
jgi:hypothetical protein